MKLREWFAFWLLGLIWGSSFLWIKVALREVGPFTLVAIRLLLGLLGLVVVLHRHRLSFPRSGRILLQFVFLAVFNTALPFTLISWGETRIDSALASILNGTMPLFTILIAHYWLQDERLTLPRLAGLITGFVGVVVLLSGDLHSAGASGGDAWGQLAVLGAAASYALGNTFSRRQLPDQPPLLQATMVVLLSDLLLWLTVPAVEPALRLPARPVTWLALVWLGLFGTCLAYVLYFYLIRAWGSTRASLVTYVFPVVGLVLGVTLLGEVADWRLGVGSVLVVAGIAIVNRRGARSGSHVAPVARGARQI